MAHPFAHLFICISYKKEKKEIGTLFYEINNRI